MSRPHLESISRPRRSRWLGRLALAVAPGLAGCPGDPSATDGSDTAPETTTSGSSATASATEVPTSGPDPTTTTGGPTTGDPCPAGDLGCPCLPGQVCGDELACVNDVCVEPGAGVCGDGVVDRDEACDAGRDNGPGQACKGDCTLNACGDGDVGPGELCDDGNDLDDDACSNACTLATCGDGVVQRGEPCDDGNASDTDACTQACTLAACGDGFIQPDAAEACDAGPDNGVGKACKLDCTLNVCGDGDVGPGEACDDGDLEGGDGCSATCTVEACGNGVLDPGEACDDGDLEGGDGCSATCTTEGCGDGVLQPGEACDDGNLVDGDGCEAACTWTPCTFLWQKTHQEPGVTRHARRVATDADGNIAVVASRFPGQAESRMLALKLDPDGALLWTASAIDLRMEGHGVTVTSDGAVVATGVEYELGVIGVRDLSRHFEPDGAIGWLAHKVVPQSSSGQAAATAPDGGVILAGYRLLQGYNAPWLARVAPDTGVAAWTHSALPPGASLADHHGVTVDAAGSIYTTGRVQIAGDTRLLVRKFTPMGVPQWMATVDNPDFGFAEGRDIEAVPGGGVAVVGRFFYGNGNGGKTGGDLWVGVFDGDGDLLWSDVYDSGPGSTNDEGHGVAVGPGGHVHVAGIVRPDLTRGIYRKYDASGGLLCSVVVDPPPDPPNQYVHLIDVTLNPGGFPIVVGVNLNSIFVAELTP